MKVGATARASSAVDSPARESFDERDDAVSTPIRFSESAPSAMCSVAATAAWPAAKSSHLPIAESVES
jgi:hypothetical protein